MALLKICLSGGGLNICVMSGRVPAGRAEVIIYRLPALINPPLWEEGTGRERSGTEEVGERESNLRWQDSCGLPKKQLCDFSEDVGRHLSRCGHLLSRPSGWTEEHTPESPQLNLCDICCEDMHVTDIRYVMFWRIWTMLVSIHNFNPFVCFFALFLLLHLTSSFAAVIDATAESRKHGSN